MNLQQIEYFLAVAQYKNFTDASLKLFVSQPAISKQISLMEKEIGIQLFKRDKRSVIITPAGQIMKEAFMEIKKEYEKALYDANLLNKGYIGKIRFGYLQGLFLDFSPDFINKFYQQFPNVDLSIESLSFSDTEKRLAEESIDLVITYLTDIINIPDLHWEKILSIPKVLVFQKDYPLDHKDNLSVSDFKEAAFYLISPKELNANKALIDLCNKHGFSPSTIKYVSDPSALLLMVASGRGVGMVNKLLIENFPYKDSLRYIELEIMDNIVICYKRSNANLITHQVSTFFLNTLPPDCH